MTHEEIKELAAEIEANIRICTKEVLTVDEAAKYLGLSKSYLYKMTHYQQIPHYKPGGKICYFKRTELERWLTEKRVATRDEISRRAQAIVMRNPNPFAPRS